MAPPAEKRKDGNPMKNTFIDLHTHTTDSDGACTPQRLCALARQAGVGVLAITDHNYTADLTALRADWPDIRLIQGAEISCRYTDGAGQTTNVHVVALGIDPDAPKLRAVLAHNQPDRRPYINAILDRLRLCGIDLGDYDDLARLYPGNRRIGRMNIARCLRDRGIVSCVEQAFDLYIGAYGERRAFVPNPHCFVSLEEAVEAILEAHGAAALAHLYDYRVSDSEELVRYFRTLTGDAGGLEVLYGPYDQTRRSALRALADKYGLMYSAASDFHGRDHRNSMDQQFPAAFCAPLLRFLGIET